LPLSFVQDVDKAPIACSKQESTSILNRMQMGLDVKAERALLLFFLEV
jgi:hypothetical protein